MSIYYQIKLIKSTWYNKQTSIAITGNDTLFNVFDIRFWLSDLIFTIRILEIRKIVALSIKYTLNHLKTLFYLIHCLGVITKNEVKGNTE